MSQIACPLNFKSINSNAMRVNTAVYFVLLASYLYTQNILFVIPMYLDITWMLFIGFNSAPMYNISIRVLKLMKVEEIRTDSGPKRFAWGMAFFMLTMLMLAEIFQIEQMILIITVKSMIFTLAETMLNFCMGCFIYKTLARTKIISIA